MTLALLRLKLLSPTTNVFYMRIRILKLYKGIKALFESPFLPHLPFYYTSDLTMYIPMYVWTSPFCTIAVKVFFKGP